MYKGTPQETHIKSSVIIGLKGLLNSGEAPAARPHPPLAWQPSPGQAKRATWDLGEMGMGLPNFYVFDSK